MSVKLDFLEKLKPNERKVFFICVGIVLIALMDRLFIGPFSAKLKSIQDEIRQQEMTTKRDVRFLAYRDKILKEDEVFSQFYSAQENDADSINADFLGLIEKLASKSQVNIIKSNPSESKETKGYFEYFASVDCQGKLENIVQFMYAINSSPELLKVVKFNMNSKKSSPTEVEVSLKIVKVIVQPPDFENTPDVEEIIVVEDASNS